MRPIRLPTSLCSLHAPTHWRARTSHQPAARRLVQCPAAGCRRAKEWPRQAIARCAVHQRTPGSDQERNQSRRGQGSSIAPEELRSARAPSAGSFPRWR
jgi:hypothetical protein